MNPPFAVVKRAVVNMFSGPSLDRDVVSQARYGQTTGVVEDRGEWLRIHTPDDYSGWAESAALERDRVYAQGGPVAEVRSLFAHLYREPSVTRHAPVITVPFESRLELAGAVEPSGSWTSVRLVDGGSAWVQRGDIVLGAASLSIPETVDLARRFLGLPYTWGGTSSFGYDCSGFTQMLCRRRGYTIPRDAQPQAEWSGMRAVARDELRPGDLLYFGPSEKKITHTGMYIGNGEFIHATTSGRPAVQISRLADAHWTAIWVASRRVK